MRRCALFVLGLSLAVSLSAQEALHYNVNQVTVRPGMVPEFEDFVKKVLAASAKLNDPNSVSAYVIERGGPARTYLFASTFKKWGDLDDDSTIPQMLVKAYGDVEGAKIMKAGSASIESSETRVSRVVPELSRGPGPSSASPPAHVLVVRTEVEPSMARSYRKFLDKLKAAEDEHNPAPVSRRVSVLGTAQVWTTIIGFSKWAERDTAVAPADVLVKAYGEEETREILDAAMASVRNRTTYVLAHRPDLSRTATPSTTN